MPKSGTYNLTAYIKANITHQPSTATAELTQPRRHVGQMGIFKNTTQMIADIYREAKGEIIESKHVERAIGTKTVKLFKQHLKDQPMSY